MAGAGEPVVALSGVRKRFGGTAALDGVDLELFPGEVHALVGANGAGKSTLAELLAGLHGSYTGEVRIAGRPVRLRTPAVAAAHGIALVHQEPSLIPELPVFENVFLGRAASARLPGFVDFTAMRAGARRLFEELGVVLDVDERLTRLGPGQRQLVEIAKGLAASPRCLLLDEPTSSLSRYEVSELLDLVRRVRVRGAALVYVSHRLEEVLSVADRVSVLRDGRRVATGSRAEWDESNLVRAMVGRELPRLEPRAHSSSDEVVLRVEGLGRRGHFEDVSFSLRRGEVVGLGGLVGAGRSEVARVLFGLAPAERGRVWLRGNQVGLGRPADALRSGIALVVEDRLREGLVPGLSVRENVSLAALPRLTHLGWIHRAREWEAVAEVLRRVELDAALAETPVRRLSGGNQQKAVLARTLLCAPGVLILDEPTRGVDVAAKSEIHGLVGALAQAGTACLLVSSDLPELLALSDRILVMRAGRVVAELGREEASEELVLAAAAGVASSGPVSA